MVQIWHNNRCGKSRDAKKYLDDHNIEYEIVEYLKGNFTADDLKVIINKLGIVDINEMLRTKEKEYKELDVASKTQDEIIALVVQNPKLVERPIVINNNKAVIARPLEKIEEVL